MGTGPAGSVFGENSFYRETWGTRRGGRHMAKRNSYPPAEGIGLPGVRTMFSNMATTLVLYLMFLDKIPCFSIKRNSDPRAAYPERSSRWGRLAGGQIYV